MFDTLNDGLKLSLISRLDSMEICHGYINSRCVWLHDVHSFISFGRSLILNFTKFAPKLKLSMIVCTHSFIASAHENCSISFTMLLFLIRVAYRLSWWHLLRQCCVPPHRATWRCVRERRLLRLAFAFIGVMRRRCAVGCRRSVLFLLIGPQTRSDIAAAVTHGADTGRWRQSFSLLQSRGCEPSSMQVVNNQHLLFVADHY